jgi:hypothetical protein
MHMFGSFGQQHLLPIILDNGNGNMYYFNRG